MLFVYDNCVFAIDKTSKNFVVFIAVIVINMQ